MNILRASAALALLTTLPVDTKAAQTIVGNWATAKSDCANPEQRVTIKPLAIESGFLNCSFVTVRRQADVVTWGGHCFGPEGDRRPEAPSEDGKMVATVANGRLTLRGLAIEVGPLVSCR